MAGVNIKLSGFAEFNKKLNALPKSINSNAAAAVKDAGLQWVQLAKRAAPKDQGTIAGKITTLATATKSEVFSNAYHSRFLEFGTKKRKNVPAELVAYESSLGYQRIGDYYDFLNAILDWVKRKGISDVVNSYTGKKVGGKAAKDNQVVLAEAIAFSIIRHGIKPQPFFFKHSVEVEKLLKERLAKFLNKVQ